MMESYGEYPATPIFFVIYIAMTLYFVSSVVSNMGVVREREGERERERESSCRKKNLNPQFFFQVTTRQDYIEASVMLQVNRNAV